MAESASSRYDLTRWRWHTDTKPSWFVDNRLSNVDIIEIYISSISYNYINFLWKYTSKDATHRVVLVCRQPLKHSSMWTSSTSSTWSSFCNNKKRIQNRGSDIFQSPLENHSEKQYIYQKKVCSSTALYIPLAMVEVPHKSVTSFEQKVLFKVVGGCPSNP